MIQQTDKIIDILQPVCFFFVLLYDFVLLQHQLFYTLDLMYLEPKIQVLKLIGFCKVAEK